ncbi:MAG TPA: aspartate 1-decarboxylase [bacterium]|nr:aspartate 1-decarboxylase [bacterium]HOL34631.1 aspartate 1-decarboxylase [bacterium]HPP08177.1 aspartate 1-decarboxylase [bacterium]
MIYPICRTKIKGGKVTGKKLYYDGSITIARDILRAADLQRGDMVEVLNLNNGARITTYIIEGPEKTGEICLNGPAARFFEEGDEVVILGICLVTASERKKIKMKVISLTNNNLTITVEGSHARN